MRGQRVLCVFVLCVATAAVADGREKSLSEWEITQLTFLGGSRDEGREDTAMYQFVSCRVGGKMGSKKMEQSSMVAHDSSSSSSSRLN